MKRKNPYILVSIIWAFLTIFWAVSSVTDFADGEISLATIRLCVACGFAFTTGCLFEKARAIAEFNSQSKWLHNLAKELKDIAKNAEQARENEPFNEFCKPREVPFEEVIKK